jgi:hypothetical protein
LEKNYKRNRKKIKFELFIHVKKIQISQAILQKDIMVSKVSLKLTLFFLYVSNGHVTQGGLSVTRKDYFLLHDTLNFCESNGMKFITVILHSSDADNALLRSGHAILAAAYQRGLRMKFVFLDSLQSVNDITSGEYTIILTTTKLIHNAEYVDKYLSYISQTKVASTILAIATFQNSSTTDQGYNHGHLYSKLSKLRKNIFFYTVHDNDMKNGGTSVSWNRILTLQNNEQVVVNKLIMDENRKLSER